MIGVFAPTFSLITWNTVASALIGLPLVKNIAPTKIPRNKDTYTCLVIRARTIATIAGTNAQKVPTIIAS